MIEMEANCSLALNRIQYEFLRFRRFYIGAMVYSARSGDYEGWLLCDGRAISRETYAELFNIIGTQFGVGDGSTTFNLPYPASRLLGTAGAGFGLSTRTIGETTGEEDTTLTITELPAHTHTGTTNSDGTHTHTGTTDSDGTHTHAITDPGHSHTIAGGTLVGGSLTTATTNSNSSSNTNRATTGISINNSGAHTHNFTTNSSGLHTHTFTTNSTGDGQSFTNMPPTLFVGNLFIYSGPCTPANPYI